MKYIVIKNEYINQEYSRISFGIAAVEEYDGVTVILKSFSDLSPHFSEVESLVNLCNEQELELIHFNDIMDDFI